MGRGMSGGPKIAGARERLESGVRFVFWVAGSTAETDAFLQTVPNGDLGKLGQVVLYARGDVFRLNVDDLEPGSRFPLGTTGYEVELANLSPTFLGLELRIHPPHGQAERMILFAEVPEFNVQVPDHGIFGSYWVDGDSPAAVEMAKTAESLHNPQEPRIDVLQGLDGTLLYRVWLSPKVGPNRASSR